MIVILRGFSKIRLKNKCILYLPNFSLSSPSSPHSSLLWHSFFLAPNTKSCHNRFQHLSVFFISSFIFILPFLSYLSRIFYFSNFIMFLFLPVPLLQLGFPRPCPMLRRVHVVMVKAATRVLSTIPSPIYACTSSK